MEHLSQKVGNALKVALSSKGITFRRSKHCRDPQLSPLRPFTNRSDRPAVTPNSSKQWCRCRCPKTHPVGLGPRVSVLNMSGRVLVLHFPRTQSNEGVLDLSAARLGCAWDVVCSAILRDPPRFRDPTGAPQWDRLGPGDGGPRRERAKERLGDGEGAAKAQTFHETAIHAAPFPPKTTPM